MKNIQTNPETNPFSSITLKLTGIKMKNLIKLAIDQLVEAKSGQDPDVKEARMRIKKLFKDTGLVCAQVYYSSYGQSLRDSSNKVKFFGIRDDQGKITRFVQEKITKFVNNVQLLPFVTDCNYVKRQGLSADSVTVYFDPDLVSEKHV